MGRLATRVRVFILGIEWEWLLGSWFGGLGATLAFKVHDEWAALLVCSSVVALSGFLVFWGKVKLPYKYEIGEGSKRVEVHTIAPLPPEQEADLRKRLGGDDG